MSFLNGEKYFEYLILDLVIDVIMWRLLFAVTFSVLIHINVASDLRICSRDCGSSTHFFISVSFSVSAIFIMELWSKVYNVHITMYGGVDSLAVGVRFLAVLPLRTPRISPVRNYFVDIHKVFILPLPSPFSLRFIFDTCFRYVTFIA